jgi:hypothetical protein
MKLVLGVAVTTLLLGVATASATAAGGGTLWVQQAKNGSLLRAGAGWKLVLDHPDAFVTGFSDRPRRTGTAVRVATFVADWPMAFGGDPPNAAIEIAGAPVTRDVALVELSAPRLSRGGKRLTYRARPLTATSASLGGLARRGDRGIAGRLGRVTVFVDDGSRLTHDPTASAK